MSATEQASTLEKLLIQKLNNFCPERSAKYKSLDKEFEVKYKAKALKYMQKNVDSLKHSNPGRAFSTLKRLGAQPGDCTDSNTFTLPSHLSDNLTEAESAERIADHFSDISKSFPPL